MSVALPRLRRDGLRGGLQVLPLPRGELHRAPHDDRGPAGFRPPLEPLEELEAVELRHVQVQDHRGGQLVARRPQGALRR